MTQKQKPPPSAREILDQLALFSSHQFAFTYHLHEGIRRKRKKKTMENEDSSSSSRPSIGFPLGLAILLILLFCISGILICYLNWHKLRALIFQSSDYHPDDDNTDVDSQSDTDHSSAVQASSPVMVPSYLFLYLSYMILFWNFYFF